MKVYLSAFLALIFSFASHANDPDLHLKCQHGVLTEIFAAKAAKFKVNGSNSAYQKARDSAMENGADLGYPDDGVDKMINAGADNYRIEGSITQRLASLSTDDIVISPLIQDCLKRPENYIRNYPN